MGKTPTQSAGDRLRAQIQAALAYAEEQRGIQLEFDEIDAERIVRAVAAADDAERLRELWLEEVTGDRRHTVMASLRSEARLLDTMALKLMAEVVKGLSVSKDRQRQQAARARWGAERGSA